MILDLRRPPITALWLGGRRAVRKRQLPPPDRAPGADNEPLGGASARHPARNGSDDAVPKITR